MTNFQKSVYEATKQIPRGETRTYKDIAREIGQPQAYRAVANALAKNYDPKIPCHRVIRSNGTLGGYNRGVAKKQKLLENERNTM